MRLHTNKTKTPPWCKLLGCTLDVVHTSFETTTCYLMALLQFTVGIFVLGTDTLLDLETRYYFYFNIHHTT